MRARRIGASIPIGDLTICYENLRSFALGERRSLRNDCQGLALLVHKGMVSWLESQAKCARTSLIADNEENSKGGERIKITDIDLTSELVRVLSNMVLNKKERVVSGTNSSKS